MFKSIVILTLLLTGISTRLSSQEIKVEASVNKPKVAVGETFQLIYKITSNAGNFTRPDLSQFNFYGQMQNTYSNSYNGVVEKVTQITYTLAARSPGKYTIAPGILNIGSTAIPSNEIKIEVTERNSAPASPPPGQNNPPNQQAQDLATYIKATVNKTTAYMGDEIIVSYKLYTRQNIVSYQDIKFPSYNGFFSEDLKQPKNIELQREVINGVVWLTAEIKKSILVPQKTGSLEIPSLSLKAIVREVEPMGGFFNIFNQYRDVSVPISSKPIKVEILPHPTQGKPVNFSGICGKFDISATLSKSEVKTGDAVNLIIKIKGSGPLKLVEDLKIELPQDIEQYAPQITDDIRMSDNGYSGSRTYDYLLLPKVSGKYTLGPFQFSYFDPQSKNYINLKSDALTLNILRGKDDLISGTTPRQQQIKLLSTDVKPILSSQDKLEPINGETWIKHPSAWVLAGSPLILILLLVGYRRMSAAHHEKAGEITRKAAGTLALKNLRNLSENAHSLDSKDLHGALLSIMQKYLIQKFNWQASDLQKDHISATFASKGIGADTIAAWHTLESACEMARYTPSSISAGKEAVQQAIVLIKNIDEKIKTP